MPRPKRLPRNKTQFNNNNETETNERDTSQHLNNARQFSVPCYVDHMSRTTILLKLGVAQTRPVTWYPIKHGYLNAISCVRVKEKKNTYLTPYPYYF